MGVAVRAKGPKHTQPLSLEEKYLRTCLRQKSKLLNKHMLLINNPDYEFHNPYVSKKTLKENIDRLFRFLEKNR